MNFEGPRPVDKKEEDPQKQAEKIFGKSLKCFKKIGKVGLAAGALFVAGEAVKSVKNDIDHNRYIESTFNKEQLKQKEANEKEIEKIFGFEAPFRINSGDTKAFARRKEDRKDPEISGFAGKNFPDNTKYFLTEKYGVYPKGWINSGISQINFVDSVKSFSENENMLGKFRGGSVYFYINKDIAMEKNTMPIDSTTIYHEIAHANDWGSDTDLNILERQSQLLEVHQRLIAPDAFKSSYYSSYLDGSKSGLFKAATEYWAEICAEYFMHPEIFLKDHPNDFKLVDSFVKKKDPTFNIFNKNRGAFDPQTGELRDIYKDK